MTDAECDNRRIAFVKFSGMAPGGTEEFLRECARGLAKCHFDVSFFWTPRGSRSDRWGEFERIAERNLTAAGVRTVKVNADGKKEWSVDRVWRNNNFFEKFHPGDFDLVVSGRDGTFEFPFTRMRGIRQLETLHYLGGTNVMPGTVVVAHISRWSAEEWVRRGGPAELVRLIDTPVKRLPVGNRESMRRELGLQHQVVFGLHQRADDDLFSPIPLAAYAQIESSDTAFLLLNGSGLYEKQASDLGIKSFKRLPEVRSAGGVADFLSALDIYAHGRRDGELNSRAIAEAFSVGLPVVTHCIGTENNGQATQVRGVGCVAYSMEEYYGALERMMNDHDFRNWSSHKALEAYNTHYAPESTQETFSSVVEEAMSVPLAGTQSRMRMQLCRLLRLPNVLVRQGFRLRATRPVLRQYQLRGQLLKAKVRGR